MNLKKRKYLGFILTLIGILGIILAPSLGFTSLGRPWSFIAGFGNGLIAGLGSALLIGGYLAKNTTENDHS